MPELTATKAPKKGFRAWLRQFKGEDSAFGDLAGDIERDGEFPRLRDSLTPALDHLEYINACEAAVDCLKEAWSQYRHYRNE